MHCIVPIRTVPNIVGTNISLLKQHPWPINTFTKTRMVLKIMTACCMSVVLSIILYCDSSFDMLGLRDSFAAFWAKIAQEYVDNPYVIGYELFNEPWAGI